MVYIGLTLFFIILEMFYFRLAKRFGILDVPNHRSAHQNTTIRGIGVLFPIAVLSFFVLNDFQYPYFVLGLFLLSTISFMDDIRPLTNRYRIITQFTSISLLLYELFQYNGVLGFAIVILLMIISVGIINAYNFMDGINGITGAYSLVLIVTLYYIEHHIISFINDQLLIITGISIGVFLFFNFRKKAVGFCGDVGSVSMAFIVLFCLGMLILKSGDWKYIFLLSVYGIDTIYTLIYRLLKRENIFMAHKLHFFQILVHEYRWSHLLVSLLFVLVQLIINIFVLHYSPTDLLFYVPLIITLSAVQYFRNRKSLSILNN